MTKPYIVVAIADAQLMRIGLGMLYAQHNNLAYPMPGETLYIWDPLPNAAGTLAAFGPLEEIGDNDDFHTWVPGKSLETEIATLTVPSASELAPSWFPAPPPPPGG